MGRLLVIAATLTLVAACNSGPTEQEQNLSERGGAPEVLANAGAGNTITPGTLPASEQAQMGDTMPDEPAGPRGDRGSGTGGDSVPGQ